jgi:hypothetical protein
MYDPSALLTSFLVRTTTAVETAPFNASVWSCIFDRNYNLVTNRGIPSFVPPKTRIVKTSLAPVLSATS